MPDRDELQAIERRTLERLRALRHGTTPTVQPSSHVSPAIEKLLARRPLGTIGPRGDTFARGLSRRAIELARTRRPTKA